MDIFATDKSFAISIGPDSFLYRWNKDKTLAVWENPKSEYKRPAISVQTNHGDFIEATDKSGKVICSGGDGETCWLPIGKEPVTLRFRELPKIEMSKVELEKRRITVTRYLYSDSPYSLGLNDKLTTVIAILEKKLSKIPKAYRDTAEIEFRNRMSYGESYENVEITWTEPETDEELMQRLQIEAERARVAADKERAQFKKLRDKFCGTA